MVILNREVREGLCERLTFEQRLEGSKDIRGEHPRKKPDPAQALKQGCRGHCGWSRTVVKPQVQALVENAEVDSE